ncbi:MAG: type II secretion system F family protein, partial [Gammaproteobacteria bacterium]|nr:type II secretion system F family protein [Gammaproteobacteria bacterium]
MSEATFVWEGTDKQGRKTKGEISSVNPAVARAELRKQGISATRVRKKSTGGLMAILKAGGKVATADISLFSRQMATMMKAGVPLVQSFDIVADGVDKPALKEMIKGIRNDVAAGNTFASCLRKYPDQFDDLFCNLVEAGEQSGALETMLARVATYKEKTESLKARIKKAMFYPVAVMVVAFIVSAILLIFVVPQFKEIFSSFGAELPYFTLIVIGMSESAQEYWFHFLVVLVVTVWIVRQFYKRSKKMRDTIDRILLKVPVMGNIINKSAVARYCRTLSTTFA